MRKHYPEINLKPGRDAPLRRGHPWLFSGALAQAPPPELQAGELAIAVDATGRPVALGFCNPRSDIIFRLLTRETDAIIDGSFWRHRIRQAMALRARVVPAGTTAYRLVNAEGDMLPGLVVDRYGEQLVMSIETAGMECQREELIYGLLEECGPAGVYERSDGSARRREGLPARVGVVAGAAPPPALEIVENGLVFAVDIRGGQKTGFFLDQRVNRQLLAAVSREARVLNCFAYTASFSVSCLQGGAARVVSVEASATANELARRNLERNGFDPLAHPLIQDNVFTFLRTTEEQFDIVILDPPAFAKSGAEVRGSLRGYRGINLQAARRLREGGLLATFSCSSHVDAELFASTVADAVAEAGRIPKLLAALGPGPDHPTALAHREGRYLKGLLLAIDS